MTAQQLKEEVERELPQFAQVCHGDTSIVVLNQDAFAAGFEDHEFISLGKAIKYDGIFGREVRVLPRQHGVNPQVQ